MLSLEPALSQAEGIGFLAALGTLPAWGWTSLKQGCSLHCGSVMVLWWDCSLSR